MFSWASSTTPSQCCPKSIKATWSRIFVWSLPKIIKKTLHMDFFTCNVVCLYPQGQHYIGYLPIQCCAESIKTILHRIFPCVLLSGASCTTFHKVFTYAMLSQKYEENTTQDFILCNVVSSLSDNTVQGFYLWNVVLGTLRQHWKGFFLVQCCVDMSRPTLHKEITCGILTYS